MLTSDLFENKTPAAWRAGYERGLKYYLKGPTNPYKSGTEEYKDFDDGYHHGELDGREKYNSRTDEGSLNEFAPGSGGDDDIGDDPYKYPEPKRYGRSVNFFGQFEADHFDREDMNDATGEFKGYWNSDGKPKQIAYFKFDDPAKTGGDDSGMGWYYEPQSNSRSDNVSTEPAVDNFKKFKQQELDMIRAFLKSGNRPSPGSQIYQLMKKHGIEEGQDNPYGYQVGQTVKLQDGSQGQVLDIFDDSIEVLLVGGRTVTVDFRDAQVISEQGVAETLRLSKKKRLGTRHDRFKSLRVSEDQVPSEVTHRVDIDRTADIEVLGVDHNAKTFNITYNKKPYTVKTSLLSQEDFDHWQIADYEVEIINSNGKDLLDMIDWNNEGDAKTDRQLRMIDTIIAYLDTQRTSDIQYMAWKDLADDEDAAELYNEIKNFYNEDQQKINRATQWLSKNIQDADVRQEFATFLQKLAVTQGASKTQKAVEYLMYLAFSYSREGNTEVTPGMKLPGIRLTDPDDEDELAQKMDALFKKVEFKFDAFEKKIIELGETFGFGTPDLESGLGARSMYWDRPILTSQPTKTASTTATNILKFKIAIDKYVQSFSSSLTKIGLPGITEHSTWEGVLSDKLTNQQEDYFATPEGFANIANGKIDVSKMINDNIQKQGVKEGVVDTLKGAWEKIKDFDNPARQKNNQELRKKQQLRRKEIKNQDVLEELSMKHQRDHKTQKYADRSNSLAQRSFSMAQVPNVTKSADGHPTVKYRTDITGKAGATRVDPTITPTTVKRKNSDKPIPAFLKKQEVMVDEQQLTEQDLAEAVSTLELADILFKGLEQKFPKIIERYGHEVVGNAIMDVAEENLDVSSFSEIDMLIDDIIEKLQNYNGNDSGLRESTVSRLYYNVVGTSAPELRKDFGMRHDRRGWFLSESSGRNRIMDAQRAFGSPKLVEYSVSDATGGAAQLGPDNVISPVGSVPKSQRINTKKARK